jgi:hypothetical protein
MEATATASKPTPVAGPNPSYQQVIKKLFEDYQEKVGLQLVLNLFSRSRQADLIPVQFSEGGSEGILECLGTQRKGPVFTEARTGKRYFHVHLPPDVLCADTTVNPRGLVKSRLLALTEAFVNKETRFASSNARLVPLEDASFVVMVFDGSHGAAAELFAGSPIVPVKLYLPHQLNDDEVLHWNNHAHMELRQQEFRGQVLLRKRNDAFQKRMKDFMKDKRYAIKSESEFLRFVSPLERNGMAAALVEDVIDHVLYGEIEREGPEGPTQDKACNLAKFINLEDQSRRGGKLLSFALVRSTLFNHFISYEPCHFDKAKGREEDDPREREKLNMTRLGNLIAKYTLQGKWNEHETVEVTGKKVKAPTAEALSSERLWKKGAVRFWSGELKNAIALILAVAGSDVNRIFQLQIASDRWQQVESAVKRLASYQAWSGPTIEPILNTNVLDQVRQGLDDWATANNTPRLSAYYLADKNRPD